ncbi:hypothetical protein MHY1_00666 [Methylovirgula sp. HY1]|nr:hypothetical protein MHY1_00666 [Methylovirgula sp. HY1]
MLGKGLTRERSMRQRLPYHALAIGIAFILGIGAAAAADLPDAGDGTPPVVDPTLPPTTSLESYFAHWQDRVREAQATQPHWMTPLVTVTPRLEQEIRYDQYFQRTATGADVDNFDSGKGLELIPTTTEEILINAPPWQQRTIIKPVSGFGDWPFLTIKQRIISAPEDQGNYIVTAFLGFQAPIGAPAFTNGAYVITPTIAGGKGWGDFDIQATMGVPIPTAYESAIGTALVTNVALQYHIFKYFWPEVEFNDTYWFDGMRGGENQLFITPGVIVGRFPIGGTAKLIFGLGYQFAVTPSPVVFDPALTPTYNHAWLLTARMAF